MSKERIIHLLVPKKFEIWCRQGKSPGKFDITNLPSKATCANCLTAMRSKTIGNRRAFAVSYTGRDLPEPERASYLDGNGMRHEI